MLDNNVFMTLVQQCILTEDSFNKINQPNAKL